MSVQRVPWQPAPLAGDRDLLLLALYNLVDNALKFSPRTPASALPRFRGYVIGSRNAATFLASARLPTVVMRCWSCGPGLDFV